MSGVGREWTKTPIGWLTIEGTERAITGISFGQSGEQRPNEMTRRAVRELKEYFDGTRRDFEVPLAPTGTEFQQRVWKALEKIPYGETRSYGEIAARVDCPKGARAVGMANNRNPIVVVIPCHRVVGADGSLVGYGGGLDIKKMLLEWERNEGEAQMKGKEKIAISACLLGEPCRYDGASQAVEELISLEDRYEWVPICPERLGGLSTPRTPSEIVGERVMMETGEDVTEEFFRGAEAALKIAMDAGVKRAILKSRSSSCGYGEVYDGSFSRRLTAGSGITAELFASWGIEIENEENYIEKERAEE